MPDTLPAHGHGIAIHKSDVSTMPDSTLGAGTVLFVSQQNLAEIQKYARTDSSDIVPLHYASFQLHESDLVKLGGVSVEISPNGEFEFDVPAGQFVVCLADDHAPGTPYLVIGCDIMDLAKGTSFTISIGEGGVELATD